MDAGEAGGVSNPMSDFLAPYHALTQPGRLVALVCGVVHPHSLTPNQLAKVLVRARFSHGNRPIHLQQYKLSCKDVIAAGIVFDTGYRGKLRATDDWAPWLTLQAFRDDRLASIEGAYHGEFPPHWGGRDYEADAAMRLRSQIVSGRFEPIDSEFRTVNEYEWRWLARPGVAHLLTTVPQRYADQAFAACFAEVVERALAPGPILEAYANSGTDRARHAAEVAFIHVLQGAPKDALAVFEELPDDLRKSKPARTGLASTRALIAMLRSDDAEAARYIDEAIACDRAGTRKRNVFPQCSAFTLSLLSLVREHTPANAAKLDHLIQVGGKLGRDPLLLRGVSMAVHVRQGGSVYWSHVQAHPGLGRLIEGLTACWADDFPEDDPGGRFAALLHFGANAVANGYRWLSIECLEVYRRWWQASDRLELELAEMIGFKDKTTTPTQLTAAVHEELGTTTLASLITPVPEWEYFLRGNRAGRVRDEDEETQAQEESGGRPAAAPGMGAAG